VRKPIPLLAAVAALAALAAGPASAQADSMVVGANFSTPGGVPGHCSSPGGCGVLLLDATSPSTSTASPVEGVVTSWRIKGTSAEPGYSINVVRKNIDGTYTVTAAGPSVTPEGSEVEAFTTDLPIKAGEYVEANLPEAGGITILGAPSVEAFFIPSLAAGETREPVEEDVAPITVAFNATIEFEPAATPVLPPTTLAPAPAPATHTSGKKHRTCKVPKLKGRKLKAARRAIRKAHCKVGNVSRRKGVKSPRVVKQRPRPHVTRRAGTKVNLKLG
jgi:hypothetical protein